MSIRRFLLFLVVPLLIALAGCNSDPKAACKKYVANGNKYFNNGKYKEASIMYRRALSKDMRYADAWYHLGLTDLRLRMAAEARRDFLRANETDPNNMDAVSKLAEVDLLFYSVDPQGNRALLTDIKDLTQQLLKKDPKSFDGLRLAAYVALSQKDQPTAIQRFKEANQVKPGQPELVQSLVQSLFATQQDAEAEKYAKELIQTHKEFGPIYDTLYMHDIRGNHLDEAEALMKQKVANNPTVAGYQLQLAFHYYATKRQSEMATTLTRITSDPKTYPDGRLQVGDFYLRVRDFDNALLQYDQGQRENSKNKRLYQKKMVEVLGTQGKYDQAGKIVQALLKDDPKDPEATAMHATLLLQTGDQKQAKTIISELQPLVSKMPKNASLHFNMGKAYMIAGDPASLELARLQFLEALKIEPRFVPPRLALSELELARGDSAKAAQSADEILKIEPTNLTAMVVEAAALLKIREFEKARELLTTALKLYPTNNDARFQFAQLNFAEKRYKEAETNFAVLKDANDPRGLPGMMEAKIAQGQFTDAVKFAEEQIRKSPDRDDYRAVLGRLYFRANRNADAVGQFQKLVDKHPDAAQIWTMLGEAKRFAGDTNGAIEALKKAKALEPNNYRPCLSLALLYDSQGRMEEARRSYEDTIRLQPDNVDALNNLAYLKADSGVDLDQAMSYAQRAQQKQPNNPEIQDTVAYIYIQKHLTDKGLDMLRTLVAQKPDSPLFHLHLAMALYQKGDRPTAKKELEAAMRNKPTEKEQGEIKQLMAKLG
jgi:tetratricopeptide (TPR) repeat protein